MSKTLTATDRKSLIRLASSMGKGSPERKAILAGLTKAAMEHASPEALKKYLKDHPKADKSKHTVSKGEGDSKGDSEEDSEEKKQQEKLDAKAKKSGKGSDIQAAVVSKVDKDFKSADKRGQNKMKKDALKFLDNEANWGVLRGVRGLGRDATPQQKADTWLKEGDQSSSKSFKKDPEKKALLEKATAAARIIRLHKDR